MQEQQLQQLVQYIQQNKAQGTSEEAIRAQLVNSGRNADVISAAFYYANNPQNLQSQPIAQPQPQPKQPGSTKRAILWICSPFIILVGTLLLTIFNRSSGLNLGFISILALLGGMIGVVLLFVGPIVGIIKLAKK